MSDGFEEAAAKEKERLLNEMSGKVRLIDAFPVLLTLYACTECGFVGTKNFRDHWCPVCKVAMKVERIMFRDFMGLMVERGPAPHEDET